MRHNFNWVKIIIVLYSCANELTITANLIKMLSFLFQITRKWEPALQKEIPQDLHEVIVVVETFNPLSARTVCRRQNLSSVDVKDAHILN